MTMTQPDVTALWDELCSRVKAGNRFAGLFATKLDSALVLSAHIATADSIDTLEVPLPPTAASYPALTPAQAVGLQPLACVLYAVEQLPDLSGRHVGIIGQGSIGLLFSYAVKAAGARHVTGIDPVDRAGIAGPVA